MKACEDLGLRCCRSLFRQVEGVVIRLSEEDREMVVVKYEFSRIFGQGFNSPQFHYIWGYLYGIPVLLLQRGVV